VKRDCRQRDLQSPINDRAREHFEDPEDLTERAYVERLYRLPRLTLTRSGRSKNRIHLEYWLLKLLEVKWHRCHEDNGEAVRFRRVNVRGSRTNFATSTRPSEFVVILRSRSTSN
jgi:hypothetical protein